MHAATKNHARRHHRTSKVFKGILIVFAMIVIAAVVAGLMVLMNNPALENRH